ncbi:hypothetical protein F4808DRAFT_461745 [Astrocystis sublimbata]|nr:hypothetical protein F4808DRAFT_461745 [Astrocystis sublimbata]
MDPFAVLSTAAAIAQFVELSFNLITKAYDVYNSVSGLSAEDEQLEFMTNELSRLMEATAPTKPESEQTDAEKALARIAAKCRTLAEELFKLLARIKTKKPHSLRASAVAALRSRMNEKEKKMLKAQAEECRQLLQGQLSVMMHSDTAEKLEELVKTGISNEAQLASLQKHVGVLQTRATLVHLGGEAEAKLKSLLELSDDALDSVASHRVLSRLSLPGMHSRYDQVMEAHSETFEWIFKDESQRDKRAKTGRSHFRHWLSSDEAIFHLAGKPGSGKSTLMKFIYKHERTKHLLESWVKGRKLLMGRFFFWRPGQETQNTITAMVRTLLYEVLEEAPELVKMSLPRQWALVRKLPWQAPVNLLFDGDEIRDAFRRLLENRNYGGQRCFCLFIDGLDEYRETRGEGYKALASMLSRWAESARGDIKLCVSSREYIVLLDSFSGARGLRLQDLTWGDITAFVREKLESNQNYLVLKSKNYMDNSLLNQIVQRADGVFLPTTQIEFIPLEMEDLFKQLYDSIHETDKEQSAQYFQFYLESFLSEVPRHYSEQEYELYLSLLRYSLLDEYARDPMFASKIGPEQPMIFRHNMTAHLERARRQLYQRTKGLLEVVHDLEFEGGKVAIIHRSVYEFLMQDTITEDRICRLRNFDMNQAICQTLVAEIAMQYAHDRVPRLLLDDPVVCQSHLFSPQLLDIFLSLCKNGSGPDKPLMSALLNLQRLQNHLDSDWSDPHLLKPIRGNTFGPILSPIYTAAPDHMIMGTYSIPYCAAHYGFRQYFTGVGWPRFAQDGVENGGLVLAIICRMINRGSDDLIYFKVPDSFDHERNLILERLFQQGCSPNQRALYHGEDSLWAKFLTGCLSLCDDPLRFEYIAEAAKLFLEFGAYRDMILSCPDKTFVKVEGPPPVGTTELRSGYEFLPTIHRTYKEYLRSDVRDWQVYVNDHRLWDDVNESYNFSPKFNRIYDEWLRSDHSQDWRDYIRSCDEEAKGKSNEEPPCAIISIGPSPITLRSYISNSGAPNKEALLALMDKKPLGPDEISAAPAPALLKSTPDVTKALSKGVPESEDFAIQSEDASTGDEPSAADYITRLQPLLTMSLVKLSLLGILGVLITYMYSYVARSLAKLGV